MHLIIEISRFSNAKNAYLKNAYLEMVFSCSFESKNLIWASFYSVKKPSQTCEPVQSYRWKHFWVKNCGYFYHRSVCEKNSNLKVGDFKNSSEHKWRKKNGPKKIFFDSVRMLLLYFYGSSSSFMFHKVSIGWFSLQT